MSDLMDLARTAYRDFKEDGVEESGFNNPKKDEVLEIWERADELFTEISRSATLIRKATWSELAEITPTGDVVDGAAGEVSEDDAGTHTDPIVGGTVPNSGQYSYVTGTPHGWQRVGALTLVDLGNRVDALETEVDDHETRLSDVEASLGAIIVNVTGGSANAYTAVGAPSAVTAYTANARYLWNFEGNVRNTGPSTGAVDALAAVPFVETDFTAVDDGRLTGLILTIYDTSKGTAFFRIVGARPATSKRILSRLASSFTAVQSIASPATRYSESAGNQVGSTFTMTGAYGIAVGRGYTKKIAPGDVLIAEFTIAAMGNSDQVGIGAQDTAFTTNNQILDATADIFLIRKDVGFVTRKGNGTAGESLTGLGNAAATFNPSGDTIRLIIGTSPKGTGLVYAVYKNGKAVGDGRLLTTSFNGRYLWVGIVGTTATASASVNFVSIRSPTPGSRKTVYIDPDAAAGGDGSLALPYQTFDIAFRESEYTADYLKMLCDYDRYLFSHIVVPRMRELHIECIGLLPAKCYASLPVNAGSHSFSPTAGATDVYNIPLTYSDLINYKTQSSGGFIAVSGLKQSVGRAGGNLFINHFLYKDLGVNQSPALVVANNPGGFSIDTSTGLLHMKAINSTTTAITGNSISRARAGSIATIEWSTAHGLSAGNVINLAGVGGKNYNDTQIRLLTASGTTFTYASVGPSESTAADTGGTAVIFNAADPDTINFEMPTYDHCLGIAGLTGLDDTTSYPEGMKLKLINLDFGYANASNIWCYRQQLECQNVMSRGSLRTYGWGLNECYGELRGCQGYGNYSDGLNTVGGTTSNIADADPRQTPVLILYNFNAYGNSKANAGDGVSAHEGTRLVVFGGYFIANGKAGISSNQQDVYGAIVRDNWDSGIVMFGQQGLDIETTILSATIENNGYSGLQVVAGASQTTGTYRVNIGGGSRVAGNITYHLVMSGISGSPGAIRIDGAVVKSGSAPAVSDTSITNATNNLVQPTAYL